MSQSSAAEFLLQVSVGSATAGAVFNKVNGDWVCTTATPYLRKLGIVGKSANDARALLESKNATWVKVQKEKPARTLRLQSDGEYDYQVRCCGDTTCKPMLLPCRYLTTKRIWRTGREMHLDWCSKKDVIQVLSKWINCRDYESLQQ